MLVIGLLSRITDYRDQVATVLTRLCIACLIAFWVVITIAGVLTPDYEQYRDYVSALASYGSEAAALGILAILSTAAAHAMASVVLMPWDRIVGSCVALAALALVVVASFRINCPGGAGRCLQEGEPGVSAVVHAGGVVVYTLAIVTAMLVAGVRSLLGHRRSLVGVPGLVAAVLFVVAFGGLWASSPGLPQRFWVFIGQVWLVMALVDAHEQRGREEARALARSHR